MGLNLRRAREDRGLSLEEVAQTLNDRPDLDLERKPSAIGHYESGRRACPGEILAFLAGLYEVPLAQLFPDGDKTAAKLRSELKAATEALAHERAMRAMLTDWMQLAKSTNPELAELDTQVSPPDPDQLHLPMEVDPT
jgi:transcriptional regulator with XRE-family HTH domain